MYSILAVAHRVIYLISTLKRSWKFKFWATFGELYGGLSYIWYTLTTHSKLDWHPFAEAPVSEIGGDGGDPTSEDKLGSRDKL